MKIKIVLVFVVSVIFACNAEDTKQNTGASEDSSSAKDIQISNEADTAYFAGGCFWCLEASFEQIEGVIEAISGYSGGEKVNPTYKEVSYGKTDHAEAVAVIYNPSIISYEVLLDIFFTAHDPTQLNRQGPDVGKQYRSAIFYTNATEKKMAENKMKALAPTYNDEIVTELTAFDAFYKAEEYHQDFEEKNPTNSYIVNVSKPKIEKVAKKFKDRLKK